MGLAVASTNDDQSCKQAAVRGAAGAVMGGTLGTVEGIAINAMVQALPFGATLNGALAGGGIALLNTALEQGLSRK